LIILFLIFGVSTILSFSSRLNDLWAGPGLPRLGYFIFGAIIGSFLSAIIFFTIKWLFTEYSNRRKILWLGLTCLLAVIYWLIRFHSFPVPKMFSFIPGIYFNNINYAIPLWKSLFKIANLLTLIAIFPFFIIIIPFFAFKLFYWLKANFLSIRAKLNISKIKCQYIFLGCFIILLVLPWINFKDLQGFDQNFWGSDQLIQAFSNFRLHFFGDKVYTTAIVGKNNWTLFTGELSLDDYQNDIPFSDSDLAKLHNKLDKLNKNLTAQGIKFLLVIPPNKGTIYPEQMPPEIPITGKISRLDQLMNYEKKYGHTPILDLRTALFSAKKEHTVFYSADTHWNPYGAFAGYQAIITALQKDFPNLKPHSLEDYRVVSDGHGPGDLEETSHIDLGGEDLFHLEPTFISTVKQQTTYAPGINNIIITNQEDRSLPKLVMYRDSFSIEMLPFLPENFSRGVFVWTNTYTIDENLIKAEKPDIVIVEIVERALYVLFDLPD
jgi:alginate O-acetyltransferase complex protein AlgJ